MAGIETSISLKDGVSPALRAMNQALTNLSKTLDSVSAKFKNTSDAKGILEARKQVAQAINEVKRMDAWQTQAIQNDNKRRISAERRAAAEIAADNRVAQIAENNALKDIKRTEQLINLEEDRVARTQVNNDRVIASATRRAQVELAAEERLRQIEENGAAADLKRMEALHTTQIKNDNARQVSAANTAANLIAADNRVEQIAENNAMRDIQREAQLDNVARNTAANKIKNQNAIANSVTNRAAVEIAADNKVDQIAENNALKELQREAQLDKIQENAATRKILNAQKEFQAIERTNQAVERTAQAVEKTTQATERTKQSIEKTTQAQQKTTQELNKTAVSAGKVVEQQNRVRRSAEAVNNEERKGKGIIASTINKMLQRVGIQERNKTAVERTNNAKKQGIILEQRANTEKLRQLNLEQSLKNKIDANNRAQQRFNASIRNGVSASNMLWTKAKQLVGTYMGVQAVGSIIKTADSLAANEARLNLMLKEGETVQGLSDKIYAAAMRSRSGYLAMADSVAKLGIQAGHLFGNNDQMVRFMETFNKVAVISKSTTQQTNAAMTQLIQALSFGQLRGDELKSILENMPFVAHLIADELERVGYAASDLPKKLRHIAADGKVTEDEIRAIGYEGELASNTVVNAMLNGAKKVDKMAKNMTWTWAQVWEVFKNAALRAFTPIFNGISKIIETKRFKRFATAVGNIMNSVAGFIKRLWDVMSPVVAWIFDAIAGICNFIKNNFSLIAPIIWGIVTAFTAYKTALMLITVWQGICAFATSALNVAKVIGVFVTHGITAATARYAKIQLGLNNALYACPLTWIVLAIIAVIVVIYLVIAAINKVRDTAISATGIIFGSVMWLGAAIWNIVAWLINVIIGSIFALAVIIANIVIGIMNIISGVVQAIVNAWNWCCDNMGIIFDNIGIWWTNLWADCYIFFCDFITKVLNKLSSLAEYVQPFAEVLGMDITGKLGKIQKGVSNARDEIASKKQGYKSLKSFKDIDWKSVDYLSVGKAWDTGYNSLGYLDLGNAWDKGYNTGKDIEDSVSNFVTGKNIDDLMKELENGKTNDFVKALEGGFDTPNVDNPNVKNPALDKIAGDTGDIAKSTGATADNTASSDEDLKYMRRLAEREAMNRYQLTDLKVEMTNNNSISSNVDANEVMRGIVKQITNAAKTNAESAFSFVF